jgi:OOP family OmpA-OmpF porin
MKYRFLICLLVLSSCAWTLHAQPAVTLDDLLEEAETALAGAKANEIHVLSPKRIAKAEESIREARGQMGKSSNDNLVRLNLESAIESIETAVGHAEAVKPKVQPILEARDAAKAAGADASNLATWQQAERGFAEMTGNLEQGNESQLAGLREPLAQQYWAARREALRDGLLSQAKADIAAAEELEGDKLFPTLMARARQAISRAEALLAQESLDDCKIAAREASELAVHAKGQIEYTANAKTTRSPDEKLLLPYDDLLTKMATSWGESLSFEGGGEAAVKRFDEIFTARLNREKAVQDSLEAVVTTSRESMERSLTDMQTSLADQQNRMTECEQRILDIQAERDLAVNRLRKRELTAQRAQIAQTAFDPGDAVVYQTIDGNIIIHLYGVKFSSGQATLGKDQRSILKKAAEAIAVFPDVQVAVEGHTDAEGSESSNQDLSEKRAAAVGKMLEEELKSKTTVETVGKGESSPIASNESARGRALNRRIDLVLTLP